MKTKLLSSIFAFMLFTSVTKAQTKTWDFGNDRTNWPVSSGTGVSQTSVSNLGLYANAEGSESPIVNFGAITTNNASFPDGYTATHRMQLNGAGFSAGNFSAMPAQRFAYFNVSGNCTVKVWFKTGSNGAVRTVYVTNGTSTLGSAATNTGSNTDFAIITATYSGPAAQLYVYGDAACNLYKIEVTGTTVTAPIPVLATENFQKASAVKVFSNGKQINISNVISSTQVEIYNITGALVKSVKTDSNTSFDVFASGLYIVKVKSDEGQKAVKVAVK